MKNVLSAFLIIATLAMLQACSVGPNYHRPDAPVPAAFKEAPKGWKLADPGHGADERRAWWSVYNDPQLDALAVQVAVNNQNLKAYEAAYRNALALVREAQSDFFPTISGGSAMTRQHTSARTSSSGVAELTGSWELDLWGKVRRQVESNKAAAQASAAELADLTLSAQAELVTDYFQMRYQDSLIRLLKDTVTAYERSLTITRNQYAVGVAARSDVITAETQLASARSSAIAAEELRAQYEHAIALLMGKAPAEVSIPAGELASAVPEIPQAVPSELLERRPDIAEAERAMQQQNALIGVAMAAYFPTISLSGLVGYSGTFPLLTAANSLWSLTPAGSLTLVDGGGRFAAVDAARATYDQSVAAYRHTVLGAFRDVEDELSNLQVLERQAQAQDDAVRLARQAANIALNEYTAGTSAYTAVVTAQATALSNEQTALLIRQNRLVASAALIKALGGGWNAASLNKM